MTVKQMARHRWFIYNWIVWCKMPSCATVPYTEWSAWSSIDCC